MNKLSLESLPIYPSLPDIENFIRINPKGAILGNTGIGKSLGIPAYFAKNYPQLTYYIAVPNIGTAKALSAVQRQISPGIKAGYADDINPPPEDIKIVYATSRYIEDLFFDTVRLKDKVSKPFASVLFIDEAHLSNIDNYNIVKLWDHLNNSKSEIKIPRLYLLSTTFDQSVYTNFEVFNIKITSYPITVKYMSNDYDIESKKRNDDIANLIINQHKLLPQSTIFMTFMAGKKDIFNIMLDLKKKFTDINRVDYTLIPVHSDLTMEENQKIYSTTVGRKIIITTNRIESAITIPGTIVVFDSMLEKRHDVTTEASNLVTSYISKASANQRAGRSGRLSEGTVFRMCTIKKFEELEEFKPLDIYTVPIYRIITKLILTEVEEILKILPHEVLLKAPDAIRLMKQLGIINNLNNVTELGKFYYKSQLSINAACIVWWWLKTNSTNYYAGIVLALIINNYNGNYFYYNSDEISINPQGVPFTNTETNINRTNYKSKYFGKFKGISDLHTYMNAWLDLITTLKANPKLDVRKQIHEWCITNSFKFKRIYSIYDASKRLILLINREGLTFDSTPVEMHLYNTNDLIHQIIPILKNVYFDDIYKFVNNYYIKENNSDRYRLENKENVNNYLEQPPVQVISFNEFSNPSKNIYKINFSLRLESNDMRTFNYNVIDIKQRVPKRANFFGFTGKTETTYIKYPEIDINMGFKMPFEPESPSQNLIPIGVLFPYRK